MYLLATRTPPAEVRLQDALRRVYEAFAGAPKPPSELSCLDFGPSFDEYAAFEHNDLCTVPDWLIDRLEFYEDSWAAWGSEAELRYLLPRILDRLCEHLLDASTPCHSLQGLELKLSLMGEWPELPALQDFVMALLEERLDALFQRRQPWARVCDGLDAVLRLVAALPCELAPFSERIAAHPRPHAPPCRPQLGARTWERSASSITVGAARYTALRAALHHSLEHSDLWDPDEP